MAHSDGVQAAVELLAQDRRPPGAKKLVGGDGEWRTPTGDYRIVCEIHDQVLRVLVLTVGHRRENYRRRWSRLVCRECGNVGSQRPLPSRYCRTVESTERHQSGPRPQRFWSWPWISWRAYRSTPKETAKQRRSREEYNRLYVYPNPDASTPLGPRGQLNGLILLPVFLLEGVMQIVALPFFAVAKRAGWVSAPIISLPPRGSSKWKTTRRGLLLLGVACWVGLCWALAISPAGSYLRHHPV